VKRVHDHSSLLARFETERQALALMDHPNIAAVYGAGTIFAISAVPTAKLRQPPAMSRLRSSRSNAITT
jgi:hypothetical protein